MMTANDVQALADRVEAVVPNDKLTSRRMFGGITFLLHGNMLCCASRKGLMVRVGAMAEPQALQSPYASPCLGAGRAMPGFILIEPAGLASERDLAHWVALAHAYVEKLPPKPDKSSHTNHRPQRPARLIRTAKTRRES
jgi:TfoX/Sxy family transcriptional regulator of competence genes